MIEEIGTVWLLMMVLNFGGPEYLSGNVRIEDFKAEESGRTVKTTTTGEVAFDLRPGQEKAWADFTIRAGSEAPKRLIFIIRFDTNEVYRLDPGTKTYTTAKMKDGKKMLADIQKIYLGGPEGKSKAATVRPPAGVVETRSSKQIKSDPYSTVFYVEAGKQNAVTRVDVTSKNATFSVMNSMLTSSVEAPKADKFEVPAEYMKK